MAGALPASEQPMFESFECVVRNSATALPSFAEAGGPFAGRKGRVVNVAGLDDIKRGALAMHYCALQTDLLLDWLG